MKEITSVTLQAALFSFLSTALAQLINAYKQPTSSFTFAFQPYITFALNALILTPPNFLYQEWLEQTFPTLVPNDEINAHPAQKSKVNDEKAESLHRSKAHVLIKFLLDQTVGASANTMAFIALTGLFKGNGLQQIGVNVHDDFLELFTAGWRMWPFVSLANLWVVPWEWRPVVGNTAGLCWGVYLTLANS